MATRISGFVYQLSTGLPVSGATVTPRASDGSVGATGGTNSAGYVAIAGLANKTWFGTVASASQVFVPSLFEEWVTDETHNESSRLNAHDFQHLRGRVNSSQMSSGSAASGHVLTADGGGLANWSASAAGVTDHAALTGLAVDDHTQYALLAGRAGGQILRGDTASGQHLYLTSTAHATKGNIYLAAAGGPTSTRFDEANDVFILTRLTFQDAVSDPATEGRLHRTGTGATTALRFYDTAARTVVLDTATQTLTNKTLTTPTIADFTNAGHSHQNAAGGGTLSASAIASGTMATARLGSGTADATTFLRGDQTWAVPAGGSSTLDGLTDVTITAPVTGSFLQYDGAEWIDFNLLGAANTWASLQTFTSGGTFNSTVTIADTITLRLGGTGNIFLQGTAASTLLELKANNAISAGEIRINPRVTLDLQLNGTSQVLLTDDKFTFNAGASDVHLNWNASGVLGIGIDCASPALTNFEHFKFGTTVAGDNVYSNLLFRAYSFDDGIGTSKDVAYFQSRYSEIIDADNFYLFLDGSDVLSFQKTSLGVLTSSLLGSAFSFSSVKMLMTNSVNTGHIDLDSSGNMEIRCNAASTSMMFKVGSGGSPLSLTFTAAKLQFGNATSMNIGYDTASSCSLTLNNLGAGAMTVNLISSSEWSFTSTALTIGTGNNITIGTTGAGTKIGNSATALLSVYDATPLVRQAQTVDLKDAIVNFGIVSGTGGATPLNLDGGDLTCATANASTKLSSPEWEYTSAMTLDCNLNGDGSLSITNNNGTANQMIVSCKAGKQTTLSARIGGDIVATFATANLGDNDSTLSTIKSATVFAKTLGADGDYLTFEASFAFSGSALPSKQCGIIFAGSLIYTSEIAAFASGNVIVRGTITRISSTTMRAMVTAVTDITLYTDKASISNDIGSLNFDTTDYTLGMQAASDGTGEALTDVTAKHLIITWHGVKA